MDFELGFSSGPASFKNGIPLYFFYDESKPKRTTEPIRTENTYIEPVEVKTKQIPPVEIVKETVQPTPKVRKTRKTKKAKAVPPKVEREPITEREIEPEIKLPEPEITRDEVEESTKQDEHESVELRDHTEHESIEDHTTHDESTHHTENTEDHTAHEERHETAKDSSPISIEALDDLIDKLGGVHIDPEEQPTTKPNKLDKSHIHEEDLEEPTIFKNHKSKHDERFTNIHAYAKDYIPVTGVEAYNNGKLSATKKEKLAFFHGTSSVTLLMLDNHEPVFEPTIQLLKRGIVPLSGELHEGIGLYGINANGLSMAPYKVADTAFQYSKKYNPPKSFDECLKVFNQLWSTIEKAFRRYDQDKEASDLTDPNVWTRLSVQIMRMKILDYNRYEKEVKPSIVNSQTLKDIGTNLDKYIKINEEISKLMVGGFSPEEASKLYDVSYDGTPTEGQWNTFKSVGLNNDLQMALKEGYWLLGKRLVYFYQHRNEFPSLMNRSDVSLDTKLRVQRYNILMNAINSGQTNLSLKDFEQESQHPIPVVFAVSEKSLDKVKGFSPMVQGSSPDDVIEVSIKNPVLGEALDSIIVKPADKDRVVKLLSRFDNLNVTIYFDDKLFEVDDWN
jgi:hypothetical protein